MMVRLLLLGASLGQLPEQIGGIAWEVATFATGDCSGVPQDGSNTRYEYGAGVCQQYFGTYGQKYYFIPSCTESSVTLRFYADPLCSGREVPRCAVALHAFIEGPRGGQAWTELTETEGMTYSFDPNHVGGSLFCDEHSARGCVSTAGSRYPPCTLEYNFGCPSSSCEVEHVPTPASRKLKYLECPQNERSAEQPEPARNATPPECTRGWGGQAPGDRRSPITISVSDGNLWLSLASCLSTALALGTCAVIVQWCQSGASIADPMFKPLSGHSLRFQMGTTLAVFATSFISMVFAVCGRMMVETTLCTPGSPGGAGMEGHRFQWKDADDNKPCQQTWLLAMGIGLFIANCSVLYGLSAERPCAGVAGGLLSVVCGLTTLVLVSSQVTSVGKQLEEEAHTSYAGYSGVHSLLIMSYFWGLVVLANVGATGFATALCARLLKDPQLARERAATLNARLSLQVGGGGDDGWGTL